jgi:hypothetical protein
LSFAVPPTHVLVLEQQNPELHMPSLMPPHDDVHAPPLHVGVPPVHAVQAPDSPHVSFDEATQLPFEQQKPPLHAPFPAAPHAATHAPALHVGVPFAHATHAPPPVPHASL